MQWDVFMLKNTKTTFCSLFHTFLSCPLQPCNLLTILFNRIVSSDISHLPSPPLATTMAVETRAQRETLVDATLEELGQVLSEQSKTLSELLWRTKGYMKYY